MAGATSTTKLEGKTALITGAGKGLGKAMALALADAGARLALVSRNLKLLSETATAVCKLGAEAGVFQTDVTDEAQVPQLGKAVARRFGRVQILINNAGMNLLLASRVLHRALGHSRRDFWSVRNASRPEPAPRLRVPPRGASTRASR